MACLGKSVHPELHSNIHPTIFIVFYVVILNDFVENTFYLQRHEFRMIHGGAEIEILTSSMTNTALVVDITELKRSFAVVRSEVGVATSQGSMKLHPTVSLCACLLFFEVEQQQQFIKSFRSTGMSDL